MGRKFQSSERCPSCGNLLIREETDIQELVAKELAWKSWDEEILRKLKELVRMRCDSEEEQRRVKEIIPADYYNFKKTPAGKRIDILGLCGYFERAILHSQEYIERLIREGYPTVTLTCEKCDYNRILQIFA